jgi:hypothetical protein
MRWNKKLSRPLVLKDGKRLANITHSAPIAHAGELLLKAAETGKRADIEAATEQIERVLRSNRMMG